MFKYIEDDEILYIPPKDLSQQTGQGRKEPPKNNKAGLLLRLKRFFWDKQPCQSSHTAQHIHRHAQCECGGDALQNLKVFVILHKGQPHQELYSERVPANTLVIRIDPKDCLRCNIFEALPVPLRSLQQEKQRV